MNRGFDDLLAKVSQVSRKKVSVACAHDSAVLEAVETARKRGIADAVLVGDAAKMKELAAADGIDISLLQTVKNISHFCLLNGCSLWCGGNGYRPINVLERG